MRSGRYVGCASLWALVVLSTACVRSGTFQCVSNEQCGVGGICEGNGECSFEDSECPSGRRWGHLATGGNADRCVDEVAGTGTAGDSGDDDAGGSSSQTSSGGDGSTGIAPGCGGEGTTAQCAPDPPAGWMGPLLALQSSYDEVVDAACPAYAPQDLGLYFDELTADPAQCQCSCEPTFSCDGFTLRTHDAADFNCEDPQEAMSLFAEECTDVSVGAGGNGGVVSVQGNGEGSGECQGVSDVAIPPPTWGIGVRLCGADPVPCDAGTCVPGLPSGPEAAVCIVQSGAHACPLSGYTQAREFFTQVQDGRGCEACQCSGVPGGGGCVLDVFTDNECADGSGSYFPSFQETICLGGGPDGGGGVGVGSLQVRAECGGDTFESAPQGAAAPADPVTVCCLP